MSYHRGLGLELNISGGFAPSPNLATNLPTGGTPQGAWAGLNWAKQAMPAHIAGLTRLKSRAAISDRVAFADGLAKANVAYTLMAALIDAETRPLVFGGPKRSFVAWSATSLAKLRDIGRSGGLPGTGMIAMITRNSDPVALSSATLAKAGWDAVAAYLGQLAAVAVAAKLLADQAAAKLLADQATAKRLADQATAAAAAEALLQEQQRAAELQRQVEAAELQRQADAAYEVNAAMERQRQADAEAERNRETVEDVIRDTTPLIPDRLTLPSDQYPTPLTVSQLVPGTTAPPPDRKWLYIGAGLVGLGLVGYFVLKD